MLSMENEKKSLILPPYFAKLPESVLLCLHFIILLEYLCTLCKLTFEALFRLRMLSKVILESL